MQHFKTKHVIIHKAFIIRPPTINLGNLIRMLVSRIETKEKEVTRKKQEDNKRISTLSYGGDKKCPPQKGQARICQ
jgi:hypothetical protein